MRKKVRISYAQKSLPFTESRGRALAYPFKRELRTLIALIGVVTLFGVAYGAIIAVSVHEIALRESALRASRDLSQQVATLEGQYLDKTRAITEEYARSLGYVAARDRVFVARPTSLTYTENAR